MTMCDSLSHFLYATLGLHSVSGRNLNLKKATCAIWVVIHTVGIVAEVTWWYRDFAKTQTISSSLVAIFLTSFLFIGAAICFHAKIIFLHDELQQLREREGRLFGEFLVQILFSVPPLLIGVRETISERNMETLLMEIYFALLQLCTAVFFMICNDVLINLQTTLNNILACTADTDMDHEKIRRERWSFRDRIKDANEIFSWTWATHHVRNLFLAVFIVSEVMRPELGHVDRAILVIYEGSQLARLFALTWRSSVLKTHCLTIEERFLNKIQAHENGRQAAREIFPAITYREEWDILQNGCFPLETRYFFSFLATCVTLTAVILQFDQRIQRMMNE